MNLLYMLIEKIKSRINTFRIEKKHEFLLHAFLIFVTIWLRFVSLGYSDYQGDEIKAMYRPESGQTFSEFMLDQRKGPLQFIITASLKSISNNYYDNLVLRFPFALAGAYAVFVFFKLVKLHYGKKIALLASLFMAINGFYVAFSRIVQYQSFTILFFLLALYFFSLALYTKRWRILGWYFGAVCWGISALAHYDAIFVAPFVVYIFISWWKKYDKTISKTKRVVTIVFSALVTLAILSAFYVPYITNLTDYQFDYWLGRLEDTTGKISNSVYLFGIYNPIVMVEIYLGLVLLSLFKFKKLLPVLIWTAFPLIFMELITDVPGTHIYTYILPATILMAFGLQVGEKILKLLFNQETGKKISVLLISVLFVFSFLLSHTVFIDHTPEYPWQSKKFLIWDMPRPQLRYHLSIFGFPYYRHWEEVEDYIRGHAPNQYYGTNERKSIPRFYLDGLEKEGEMATHFVKISNPQSFASSIYQDKPYHWIANKNQPATVEFKNGDKIVTRIYTMPEGTIDDLRIYFRKLEAMEIESESSVVYP